jgi:hypothetical protein
MVSPSIDKHLTLKIPKSKRSKIKFFGRIESLNAVLAEKGCKAHVLLRSLFKWYPTEKTGVNMFEGGYGGSCHLCIISNRYNTNSYRISSSPTFVP